MADQEQLAILKEGVSEWNEWRGKNPDVPIDLSKADLMGADLSGANLIKANLNRAHLIEANLRESRPNGDGDAVGADGSVHYS